MSLDILLINWQDPQHPQSGGAEVHLHQIFSRIVNDYGHRVTLLACSFKGAKPVTEIDGIKVIRHGKRETFNLTLPFFYRKYFGNKKWDIVIEDLNKIPFYTMFYIPGPKLAILHHFFGKAIFQQTNPLFGSYVYITERSVPRIYRKVPFIVVSMSTKEDLISHGVPEANISVIYNGLSHEYSPGNQKFFEPTIVYLGRLKKYKRIDLVLKVFKDVRREIPESKLLIVGEGDYKKMLIKLAQRLNLKESVEFTGYVPHKKKIEILQKSWLTINTSIKEGFGLVIIEAQACGTPAIVLNSPGLRETVKHNETGFVVNTLDEMKEKTLMILKNESLRRKLSNNAVKWAKQFSWDESAREVNKKIIEVISEKANDNKSFPLTENHL